MTAGEAARKGHAGGYILRVVKSRGMERYLADYRRSDANTTTYPALAERFEYKHQAREMAKRAGFYTSLDFEVTTVPAELKPCRCKVERMPVAEAVCDYTPEDDGLTEPCCSDDIIDRIAFELALDEVFPELDDEDADIAAASLQHPGARPTVAGAVCP